MTTEAPVLAAPTARPNGPRRWWPVPLVAGLAIRLILAPYTSVTSDVAPWAQTVSSAMAGLGPYRRRGFSYPPVWGYLLSGLGRVFALAGGSVTSLSSEHPASVLVAASDISVASVTSPLFNVLFKSILFAFDVGVAILVRRVALHLGASERRAGIAAGFAFFNPLVIFISAVHGTFDVMIAFFTLLAIAALLERRDTMAGASLAAGIMTKLAPVFLVPLVVAWLVIAERERPRDAVPRLLRVAAGGAAAIAVLGMPVAFDGTFGQMITSVFSRSGSPTAAGGLGVFGVRHLARFSWVQGWAGEHSTAVTLALYGSILLGTALVAGVAVARRTDPALVLVSGVCVIYLLVLLLNPSVQPQYVLWVLPIVCVVGARRPGYLSWSVVVGVAGVVFEVGITGPMRFLQPLAAYTANLSPEAVARSADGWLRSSGTVVNDSLSSHILGFAALVTIPLLLLAIVDLARGAAAPRSDGT